MRPHRAEARERTPHPHAPRLVQVELQDDCDRTALQLLATQEPRALSTAARRRKPRSWSKHGVSLCFGAEAWKDGGHGAMEKASERGQCLRGMILVATCVFSFFQV